MEVFGQIPCLSGVGAGIETRSSSSSSSSNQYVCGLAVGGRAGKFYGGGFKDNGHLQYYPNPRCGLKKEKENKTMKKKLKLLKGLSKDLTLFSDLGFGDGLVGQVQGKMLSEAAEILMKQLQQLRAEEKEFKKKRKEEKAKLKATRMKTTTMLDSESSSSSSESSDTECGELINMTHLRNQPTVTQEATTSTLPILTNITKDKDNGFEHPSVQNIEQECFTSCSNVSRISRNDESSSVTKRIEVCMGNKCKKSGGAALLEEFERIMGVEGGVVGCKCMGKCRDGPNVRLLNSVDGIQTDSVRTPPNPLCIGVGFQDVPVIVSNFFGHDCKDLGFTPAS